VPLFGSSTLRFCCFYSGSHLSVHPKMNRCLLAWTYLPFNSQMQWFVNATEWINNCPYPLVKCVTTLLLDCSFANVSVSFRQLKCLLPERSVLLRFGCFPIALITPSTCILLLSNGNTNRFMLPRGCITPVLQTRPFSFLIERLAIPQKRPWLTRPFWERLNITRWPKPLSVARCWFRKRGGLPLRLLRLAPMPHLLSSIFGFT
jgi:hypothetical protein